ncbi:MAG: arylsulfatase A-like enzyme [Chlamydiales bacterium]|jgi:arylsulfatase A-like enzyme
MASATGGMNMQRLSLLAVCVAMICGPSLPLGSSSGSAAHSASDQPKNVLLIMVDQQNAHALGCYDNGFGGVTQSLTPQLDQLAAEGVRFTGAFVSSPQCVPSRMTVLTGRWPHYHGVKWNGIFGPLLYDTFPSLARATGYETMSIGKDHLAWTDATPIFDDYGFNAFIKKRDYWDYCFDNNEVPFTFTGNFSSMPNLPGAIVHAGYTFNANDFHREGYDADQTIGFLEDRADDGKPFVCQFMPWGPHAPLLPSGPADPHDWAHLYHPFDALDLPPNHDKVASTQLLATIQATYSGLGEAEWREILSYYYGLITQVDHNLGRVLARLDELGLAENTLVVYSADHGEFGAEMSTWTKGKFHYDNINRVPLVMRLPGVLPQGKVIDSLVSNVDLFPTMVEITGVPVSDARREQMDGVSLLDLMLADQEPVGWRQEVFAELGTDTQGKTRMVRTRTAKYIFDQENVEEEFYDLAADPWEIDNVVSDPAYASVLADLKARMDTWWGNEIGHAPDYRANPFSGAPWAPQRPEPMAGATGVNDDIDPSWFPVTAASELQVFFGTDPASLPLFTTLAHMESSFNPGTLDPLTTYYWRVDSINHNGCTVGDTWQFTTRNGGAGGPDLATSPDPEHRAEGASMASQLSWSPAGDAIAQTVHFGPAGAMTQVSAPDASVVSLNPGPLALGQTYEWRVDQVDANGTTEGDVWSFTVSEVGLPEGARLVYPHHLDHNVTASQLELHWTPGVGAAFHDVYFGTSLPLPFLGQTLETSFDPGPLQSNTTYYWRVDEQNALGSKQGGTWRFGTGQNIGSNYCITNPNSTGSGSLMSATGSMDVADNDLTLHVTGAPANKFGIFFYGLTQAQIPLDGGFRCVGGNVQRLRPTLRSDTTGHVGRLVDLTVYPALDDISLAVPVSMNFQFWHRDNMGSSNLTDGVSVDFH